MNHYLLGGAITCVVVAAVIDVLTQKIPNWFTLPSALLGVILNFHLYGAKGLSSSLIGLITGFLLLFFVYRLGGMGAGDVKLLCAAGAFLGPKLVFYSFIWMALVGGVLALILVVYKKAFSQTLRNLKMLVLGWILRTPSKETNLTIKNQALIKLPYGVAIAMGVILTVWLKRIPNFGF
jgi:prepilin peptidase CpaA